MNLFKHFFSRGIQITTCHVPKELSRYISYAIQKGAKVSAVVNDTKPQPPPLLQGGLEILITMNVAWDHESNIRILQEKVLRINFTCYKDESNEIRRSIDAIEADETDSDSDNDNGNDVVLLNKINE